MKKSELKDALLNKLGDLLRPYDFTLVRRMDWFIRKGESKLIYRLDFYDGYKKDMGYTVSPSLAIRIDGVEQIYHQVSGFEPKYQKDTPTIWPTIKDLRKGDEDYEYLLDTYEDVARLSDKLFVIFRDIALPFLESHSSIQALDKLLNSRPNNENSIFPIPEDRYYRAIIVAKLAKNEHYKEIVEIYRKHLSDLSSEFLKEFEKLLDILGALELQPTRVSTPSSRD